MHIVYGQDSSYSEFIIFEGSEPYTLYISGWVVSTADGRSEPVEWSITLDSPDVYAPDVHSLLDPMYWANVNPDICRLTVGHVDSTDYDSTIIRYGAAMPVARTDGNLLWTGGALEDDTSNYSLAADSGWVYFRIFGGDSLGNWNTGAADSLFMPGAEQIAAIMRNGLFEFIMGENRRW